MDRDQVVDILELQLNSV